MSEWSKDPSGLFRFKDLDNVEVEKKPVFPDANRDRAERPALDLGELADVAMADAIRQARERIEPKAADDPAPVAPIAEAAPAASFEDLADEDLADEEQAETLAETGAPADAAAAAGATPRPSFASADHNAVVAAVEAEKRRGKTRRRLVAAVFTLLVAGGAAAGAVAILQPPLIRTDSLPVHSPALSQRMNTPELVGMAMIPPPPELVEPVDTAVEQPPEEPRRRSRDRDRGRRDGGQRLDRGDLF